MTIYNRNGKRRAVNLSKYASAYDNMTRFNPMHKRVMEVTRNYLIHYLNPDKAWNIADFGAGTGEVAWRLGEAFEKSTIHAIENNAGFLEKLKQKVSTYSNVEAVSGDIEEPVFDLESLDAITMIHVLNYTQHAKTGLSIQMAFDQLKRGGIFICADIGRPFDVDKHKAEILKYAKAEIGLIKLVWTYLWSREAVKQNRIFTENQKTNPDIHPTHSLDEFCAMIESKGFEILVRRDDLYLGDDDFVVARKPE